MESPILQPAPEAPSGAPSLLGLIGHGALVGRGREMAEAGAELRRALAGEGYVLLISGEPGVGKTRLAREVMEQMQAAGGLALASECYAEGDVHMRLSRARFAMHWVRQLHSISPTWLAR